MDADLRYGLDRLPTDQADREMSQLMDLSGRVAVVVGGGGPNLGRACVLRLAELGARVVIVGRSRSIDVNADLLRTRFGADVATYVADATDWDSIHDTAQRIWDEVGAVDVWVNNVGGSAGDGAFVSRTEADVLAMIARNINTAVYGSHAILDHMIARGSGRIINISSDSGKIARAGLVLLCTTKAAVNAFTANLSREVGPAGVRVLAVCPGAMLGEERVQILRGTDTGTGDGGQRSADYATNVRRTVGLTSLGRPSTPDEVATVVAFLSGDAASYVHGTAISVAGGISA